MRVFHAFIPALVIVGAWEIAALLLFDPRFIGQPSEIVRYLASELQRGEIWTDAAITFWEVMAGYVIGALLRLAPAHVIDNQSTHHTRGVAHKPRTVRKRSALAGRDLNVGLMQQSGRTEADRDALASQLARRQAMQFAIQHAKELVGSFAITSFSGLEQNRDRGRIVGQLLFLI